MRLGAEASAEISLWSWKLQVDGAQVVSGLSVLQIHHFQGCWGCPVGLGLLVGFAGYPVVGRAAVGRWQHPSAAFRAGDWEKPTSVLH